ncbi:MAG: DNA double-strand break repair nuclease NurA [Ardenticatenaceae bacterium]|nr:DNA double-strand break repair nuclease NurA [Ardenticatenaceae bacterium]
MSLEFEKLRDSLEHMAQTAAQRQRERRHFVEDLLAVLHEYANNWTEIERALDTAVDQADPKHYRAARPFSDLHPLDVPIDPPLPPATATLIATDGSQIMPDRHAAHLYYLLNIGGIIYHHGQGVPPEPFSEPELHYPQDDAAEADFLYNSGKVSIERDKKEIGTLADKAWAYRHAAQPLLAILDQRLLYWPIGGSDGQINEEVQVWLRGMTKIHDSGALLAGYIDRPMTGYVVTLLLALTGLDDSKFEWKELGKRSAGGGLADAVIYGRLLQPFQRSPVFVMIAPPNERFAEHDPANEVCFFYLHSGRGIARVDIPRWVAEDEERVTAVHALLVDQCQILGDYPYVIARADEMAVVGHQDHEELNFMIDLYMQKHGLSRSLTAKQGSKGLARGGKTRFGV